MSRSALAFLPKNKRLAGMAIGAFAMLAMAMPAMTQEAPNKDEVFTLTTAFKTDGTEALVSFDISWFDKKYFLAERSNNQIDVVEGKSITHFAQGIFAGVVNNPNGTANNDKSGPDGVLTANNHKELWVGDAPNTLHPFGKVWVISALDGSVPPKLGPKNVANPIEITNPVTKMPSTTRADELCYDPDPKVNLIMIASPAENANDANPKLSAPFVTFISATTYEVVGQIVFDGKPNPGTQTQPPVFHGPQASNGLEQCGWSPKTRKFYQNVPEVNGTGDDKSPGVVAVIDPKTMKVETTLGPIDITKCAGPQGMAIGPDNQMMLGCNAASPDGHRNTVMINIHTGAILGPGFPDLGGADEVWFNEGDGHYFFPSCNAECRAGTGQEVLGVIDSTGHRLDSGTNQNVVVLATKLGNQTGRRAHSVAADSDTNQVFVPIPANSGGTAGNDASICDKAPDKVNSPNDTTGCIAVFTTTHDDRSRVAEERGEDDHQQ